MARFRRSNPLALAVLVTLHERPMHPYEVAQTLRLRAKHESIRLNYGSLYTVVDSLEQHGLIEASETVREGRRPERTVYSITDLGRVEMTDWLTTMLAVPDKDFPKFEAALSMVPALPPTDALSCLRDRVRHLVVELERQRGAIAATDSMGLPRLLTLEATYRLAMLEAELAFVERLVEDVASGALDGLELWSSWYRPDGTIDTDAVAAAAARFEGGATAGPSEPDRRKR
jgi:DNA-binding PadR family transcriptional regulator